MWWGKGDTSKLGDEEKNTLAHLRRLAETGHVRALDSDKAEVGVRAVDFFGQWEGVLKALTSVRNTLLLLAGLLAIYWSAQGGVLSWVQSLITGTP